MHDQGIRVGRAFAGTAARQSPMTGWGTEQLAREELLSLGRKLRRGWSASVQQANRSSGPGQMRESLAVAFEVMQLWGEVADELIVRGPERATQAAGAAAGREPEAGS